MNRLSYLSSSRFFATAIAALVLAACQPGEDPGGGPDLAPYGTFTPAAAGGLSTAELEADYSHLARVTEENPDVTYYVRYDDGTGARYGILEGETIHRLSSHYFADPTRTGETASLRDVRLLAPVDPNRIHSVLGVALNTMSPQLADLPPDAHPRWFAKLPTSIIGPGDAIEYPVESPFLNNEGELVLVIGREARHVSVEEAPDYIWGVTAGNDMSENFWYGEGQDREGPTRLMAKGVDTWAPIGPAIAVGLDYSDLEMLHRTNGDLTQEGSSADLVQGPAALVSYISRYVTLLPGDIIFTGTVAFTPGGRRALGAGDELEVEIEGIGLLRNPLVEMGGVPWEERW